MVILALKCSCFVINSLISTDYFIGNIWTGKYSVNRNFFFTFNRLYEETFLQKKIKHKDKYWERARGSNAKFAEGITKIMTVHWFFFWFIPFLHSLSLSMCACACLFPSYMYSFPSSGVFSSSFSILFIICGVSFDIVWCMTIDRGVKRFWVCAHVFACTFAFAWTYNKWQAFIFSYIFFALTLPHGTNHRNMEIYIYLKDDLHIMLR